MTGIGQRLSRLVRLLDEVVPLERRIDLQPFVEQGEITLYVRVPAGQAVYMDRGVAPIRTAFNGSHDSLERGMSPYEQAQVREAKRTGTPVISYPTVIPNAAFLGLEAKDATLLLALEQAHVTWFPSTVQLKSQEGDAMDLHQVVPQWSPCCLRPEGERHICGPWVGHSDDHALAVKLSDVFVELDAIRKARNLPDDPLGMQDRAPAVYVLLRVAARFNAPQKGLQISSKQTGGEVLKLAKDSGIKDWLFNKTVLKQVRKLINTMHSETQGLKRPSKLKLEVLDEDEAALCSKNKWISSRMALLIHASRAWRNLVEKEERAWNSMNAEEKLRLASRFGHYLKVLGFSDRECTAAFVLAPYPDDLRSLRLKVQKERNGLRTQA